MAIFNTIVQGGGSAPEPYPLLSRVKDDSNNEIGTVCGYHTDANNQKYAVVCLDAQYRTNSVQYCSDNTTTVTNLPAYANASAFDAKETATFNCDKILDFCTLIGGSSSAVSHCRSKSFTIGGVTYYGQLPTINEVMMIFMNRTAINDLDTSASSYPGEIIQTSLFALWSSTQYSNQNGWVGYSSISYDNKTRAPSNYHAAPVLEIPIN